MTASSSPSSTGNHHAYETIVRRFQDMAVGYGYALLGDMDLAEDVAQEAFINAFYGLPELRDSAAFPGWFRRIVFTQVNRLKRRGEVATVPLDKVPELIWVQLLSVTSPQNGAKSFPLGPENPSPALDWGRFVSETVHVQGTVYEHWPKTWRK